MHLKQHGPLERTNLINLKREGYFTCDVCGNALKSREGILAHLLRLHFKKAKSNYSCDKCGKVLKDRPAIAKHLKHHLTVKPYHCNECNEAFVYKIDRSRHILKYHYQGEKFECDCGKLYRTKSRFNQCRLSHKSSRKFNCKVFIRNMTFNPFTSTTLFFPIDLWTQIQSTR